MTGALFKFKDRQYPGCHKPVLVKYELPCPGRQGFEGTRAFHSLRCLIVRIFGTLILALGTVSPAFAAQAEATGTNALTLSNSMPNALTLSNSTPNALTLSNSTPNALTLSNAMPNALTLSNSMPNAAGSLFRVFGALALVLAIFLGGVWLFRNWQRLTIHRGQAPKLNVIESRSLGGRHALYVVGYESERLLVSASPTGVTLLSHLPSAEAGSEDPKPAVPQQSFAQALAQMLKGK